MEDRLDKVFDCIDKLQPSLSKSAHEKLTETATATRKQIRTR